STGALPVFWTVVFTGSTAPEITGSAGRTSLSWRFMAEDSAEEDVMQPHSSAGRTKQIRHRICMAHKGSGFGCGARRVVDSGQFPATVFQHAFQAEERNIFGGVVRSEV